MKENMTNRHNINLDLRTRMLRSYAFAVLLYGFESWTCDAVIEKLIDPFEMYEYKRMLRRA